MENKKIQIPDGWERIKFSENVFFQEGPGLMATLFKETGFPFMNIRCIENGKIKKENCQFVSDSIAENQYKHFQLQEDDLIVSTSGTLGKKAFVRKSDLPLLLNTSIIRFRPKYENAINLHFLNYILESYSFLYDLYSQSTGSAQVNVGPTHIKKVFVTLPKSTTEQKKIAEILSKVDTAIEQTQSLIAKYQRIKTGLMQDLLTKGIDENGNIRSEETHEFKDSELGRIPKEWGCLSLQKISLEIIDCPHSTPKYIDEGYLVARTQNIKNGEYLIETSSYLSPNDYKERVSRLEPKSGDIIFTREAPIGEAFVIPQGMKISLGQRVMLFRLNNEIMMPSFLIELIYSDEVQTFFANMVGGTTVSHLNVKDVKELLFKTPKTNEQKRIMDLLLQHRKSMNVFTNKLQKLQSIKTALMQDLLSGKKRVTSIINGEL